MTTGRAADEPVRVNRAPVLTLWAAVVAEALGHAEATALSLGSVVAGTSARAKARRLGIEETPRATEKAAEGAVPEGRPSSPAPARTVRLLGRDLALSGDDPPLAMRDGRPAPPGPVRAYVARAFGRRLPEVRAAMHDLAVSLPPAELERRGFRLYEAFRPAVPEDVRGWGAKGLLHLDRIRGAAGPEGR